MGMRSRKGGSRKGGSRRQELARLILSFGAQPQNPCVTKDGQALRQRLKDLSELLVPKGDDGKGLGDVVDTDAVIAAWAKEAADDKAFVAAHRRASASNCTADKRMCAFFAELAPGIAEVGLTVREANAKPTMTGSRKVPRSELAIRVQMGKLGDIISQLGERMREYERKYEALEYLLDNDHTQQPRLPVDPNGEMATYLKKRVPQPHEKRKKG